jgi:CheY-like chemotaxis protein
MVVPATFSYSACPLMPDQQSAGERGVQPLKGISLLLVDDDADGREIFEYALTEAGATVTTAATAVEALERFTSAPPDVVVTDIAMPSVDGVWLCEQIRALRNGTENVPVVALTALVFPKDRDRIEAAGFSAYLAKPAGMDDLHDVIRSLTGRHSLRSAS